MNRNCELLMLLFASSLLLHEVRSLKEAPIVETTYGLVSGVYEKNEDGEHFFYMGIPYASVPPDNMFGDPINATAWDGIFEADEESEVCPQREEYNSTLTGDIDCLKLNVYMPATRSSEEPLAVFFWIHGGEFKYGDGGRYQWGPERLTANEIIVVTMNYRTGVFGQLCLEIPEVPGNAGLKDIIHALKWVNENIGAFGGDRNRITVGGASSGALAVDYLSVSPLAENLYNRVIMQSGTAASLNIDGSNSKMYVKDLAILTGLSEDPSIETAWKHLTKVHPYDIILAAEALELSYCWCAEKSIQDVLAVTTEKPIDLLERRSFHQVDTLIGFNSHEQLGVLYDKDLGESNDTYFIKAVANMIFKDENEKNETINLIRRFYIGSKEISNDFRYPIIDLYGDYLFIYPTMRSALIRSEKSNVFLYMFSYDGEHNFVKKRANITLPGATHADEYGYIFRQDELFKSLGIEYNESDELVSKSMAKMWTNFVKYGDPTPEENLLTPVKWIPITKNKYNYLNIDEELSMRVDPYSERMAFWELIYENYYHSRK